MGFLLVPIILSRKEVRSGHVRQIWSAWLKARDTSLGESQNPRLIGWVKELMFKKSVSCDKT